ncbi:hypothetical protein BC629DRAFT_1553912 [Irpex lacteus]|nr:hypothetical protein BC629DRAFT_1553912 [Irpex lacteus]
MSAQIPAGGLMPLSPPLCRPMRLCQRPPALGQTGSRRQCPPRNKNSNHAANVHVRIVCPTSAQLYYLFCI